MTRNTSVCVIFTTLLNPCVAIATGLVVADDQKATPIANQYRAAAERIINAILARNDAYRKMEELCDGIGHRLSGSPQLEKAIQWAVDTLKREGQENVHLEEVIVPHWVRGAESLTMIEPRTETLPMLGLGGSVGTPPEGVTATVIAVRDEAELDAMGDKVRGKIILFDNPMPEYDPRSGSGYGTTVRFRGKGPGLAAEKGAVACLIRSVTAASLRSPHTGMTHFADVKATVPAAAIATEDAAMISRLQARGVEVAATLKMEARMLGLTKSANVIAELRGSTWPDEIIVIGGHIDSWDVGQGAHDDAVGCAAAMEAVNILRRLNMIPKRTIRVVLWTCEELGLYGAKQYAQDHADELPKHVAAIEMDSGGFRPLGYSLQCIDKEREQFALEQMQDIMSLFTSIGTLEAKIGGSAPDVSPMGEAGVLLMGHLVDGSKYFDYHHSQADTLDKIKPEELSQNVALLTTVAYILADMPQPIGRRTGE